MKIKKITETKIDYKLLDLKAAENIDGYTSLIIEKDPNGNIIKETQFHSNGEIEVEHIYQYNAANYLVQEIVNYVDDDFEELTSFEYDEKGNLSKKIKHFIHGLDETIYKYNEKNQLIEKRYEDPDSEEERIDWFKYDEAGNMISVETIDNDGNLYFKQETEFSGNLPVKQEQYNGTENKKRILEYFYEGSKETGFEIREESGKVLFKNKKFFNEKDQLKEEHAINPITPSESASEHYDYNENGKVSKVSTKNAKGDIIKETEYTYNDNGEPESRRFFVSGGEYRQDDHFTVLYEYEFH